MPGTGSPPSSQTPEGSYLPRSPRRGPSGSDPEAVSRHEAPLIPEPREGDAGAPTQHSLPLEDAAFGGAQCGPTDGLLAPPPEPCKGWFNTETWLTL